MIKWLHLKCFNFLLNRQKLFPLLFALVFRKRVMPEKLYRYRPLGKSESQLAWLKIAIENEELYCSKARDFNDPFDAHSILPSKDYHTYYDRKKVEALENIIKIFKSVIFDENEANSSFENTDLEELKNFTVNDYMEKDIMEINDIFNEKLEFARIACFSETSTNMPMWWHYSNERNGVCIEFDTKKLSEDMSNHIFPVVYSDKKIDVVKLLLKYVTKCAKKKITQNDFDFISSVLICLPAMQKHEDWSYEKEWRYLDFINDHENNGISANFIKPSKIILGDKIGSSDESELIKISAKHDIPICKITITNHGLEETKVSGMK